MTARTLAFVAIACAASVAAADSGRLDEARRAVDEVRFQQALALLARAVDQGGNSPAEMRQIYELGGRSAIALGQFEVAEQFYRRWLAVEPGARLADDVAPKLKQTFAAAQAYLAPRGRLTVRAAWVEAGERLVGGGGSNRGDAAAWLDVTVDADPLAMAVAVAVDGGAPVVLVAARARISASTRAPRIAVLDARGNQLLFVEQIDARPAPRPDAAREGPPAAAPVLRSPVDPQPPFLRRWTTWAVPAVACVLAGGIVGMVALDQQRQVRDALDESREHFYSDVADRHRAIRRNATIAIGLGAAAVAFGIPTAIFYIETRRPWKLDRIPVIAQLSIDGASLVAVGRF